MHATEGELDDYDDFWESDTQRYALPNLSDAMAAFYRDPKTRKSYILICGGRIGKTASSGITLEPVLSGRFICIDVTLQIDPLARRQACVYWRDIDLDCWSGMQHRFGGTAEIVENGDSILFCVFGGHSFPKARNVSQNLSFFH